jgi:hypothetical protein
VSSQVGQVLRIGIRSSTIHTAQGAEVIVPNASLISAEVVNWTLSDRMRRVEVPVGVAYGSDPEQVRRILLAAVGGRPEIPATPAPEALLVGFGQSSLDFQLRFWVLRAGGGERGSDRSPARPGRGRDRDPLPAARPAPALGRPRARRAPSRRAPPGRLTAAGAQASGTPCGRRAAEVRCV